jgi:DNA polymerase-3 subunit gamma/tau
MALYNKYRPVNLSMVCGQDHVKRILSSQIAKNDLVHAYLFTGPAGTGKTTVARILAAMVNCSAGMTVTPPADDEFASAIMSGKCSADVVEIDAATGGGIDNIRDLRESAFYPPRQMRKKFFIIDECHRLTANAWEGLLKIIEEPPEWVVFVLCTTEPGEVIETIKTRCMCLDFRPLTTQMVKDYIGGIAAKEGIKVQEDAIRMIAASSHGSMRMAISRLEKMKHAEPDGTITATSVSKILGVADRSLTRDYVNAVAARDFLKGLEASSKALCLGIDAQEFLGSVAAYIHDIVVLSKNETPDTVKHIVHCEYTREEIADVFATKKVLEGFTTKWRSMLLKWVELLQKYTNFTVYKIQPQFLVDVAFVELAMSMAEFQLT